MFNFQKELKIKMNNLAHEIYRLTKQFPKSEIYGITSQINRASLSVILNYIEGYARIRPKNRLNFMEIFYGSLKETQYLLHFTHTEKLISQPDYTRLFQIADQTERCYGQK